MQKLFECCLKKAAQGSPRFNTSIYLIGSSTPLIFVNFEIASFILYFFIAKSDSDDLGSHFESTKGREVPQNPEPPPLAIVKSYHLGTGKDVAHACEEILPATVLSFSPLFFFFNFFLFYLLLSLTISASRRDTESASHQATGLNKIYLAGSSVSMEFRRIPADRRPSYTTGIVSTPTWCACNHPLQPLFLSLLQPRQSQDTT